MCIYIIYLYRTLEVNLHFISSSYREYLLDGLLPCTTMACFSVKNYAIAKGVVPKPLASAWMVTMALQNYPTLELMSEMLRMAQYSPSQITIFPLSIMVHNYWVNNEEIRTAATVSNFLVIKNVVFMSCFCDIYIYIYCNECLMVLTDIYSFSCFACSSLNPSSKPSGT